MVSRSNSRKILPRPTPGNLSKYGYKNVKTMPATKRRVALLKAVKNDGYATIIRRLNLIANYSKNKDPVFYKILQSDIIWIQKTLAQKYSKTSRKASRKTSRKTSRKVSRKASRKTSRKVSRKASRKTSRKVSRKTSRK